MLPALPCDPGGMDGLTYRSRNDRIHCLYLRGQSYHLLYPSLGRYPMTYCEIRLSLAACTVSTCNNNNNWSSSWRYTAAVASVAITLATLKRPFHRINTSPSPRTLLKETQMSAKEVSMLDEPGDSPAHRGRHPRYFRRFAMARSCLRGRNPASGY